MIYYLSLSCARTLRVLGQFSLGIRLVPFFLSYAHAALESISMTDGDKNEDSQVVNLTADTRRPTRPADRFDDLMWNNWKDCQKIFLDGYAGCAICQQSDLRSRCLACKNLSRRMVSNLKAQAKQSVLCDRIHAMLMTMAGKKALTDAFCLNASDKPKWARWPDFNFEAFFTNLDQQRGFVCSRCTETKLRSQFSRTQLQKSSKKRKCAECTKITTGDKLLRSRCQQTEIASNGSQSQMDRPPSEKVSMRFLPSTRETTRVRGYISCSYCQNVKLRTQFSHTQMHRPSLKRKCKQCTTCETESTKESTSYTSYSQFQQAKSRSHLIQTLVGEPASKRNCDGLQGKDWAYGILAVTDP